MTIVYTDAIKTTRLAAVATAIDADAGAGKIQIYDLGEAHILCVIPFETSCTQSNSGGILIFAIPTADPIAAVTGVAVSAKILTGTGTLVASGLTVGTTSAYDIQLNTVQITQGLPVTITQASITHG